MKTLLAVVECDDNNQLSTKLNVKDFMTKAGRLDDDEHLELAAICAATIIYHIAGDFCLSEQEVMTHVNRHVKEAFIQRVSQALTSSDNSIQ